jgi:heme/copper-type cytochrome/quinol oxidase subunit 2
MTTTTRPTPTEIARFRTLAGQTKDDFLKYTLAVRTHTGQYEILCSACGQGHHHEPFKFQSDATDAARDHANHCIA